MAEGGHADHENPGADASTFPRDPTILRLRIEIEGGMRLTLNDCGTCEGIPRGGFI